MAGAKKNLLQLLESAHYKIDYEPSPAAKLLTIEGNNIGSAGNYVIFSGLPKSGKSSYLSAVVASSITGQAFYGIQTHLQTGKHIGYFDTESNETDFYSNLDRIKRITGRPNLPAFFNAFTTRSFDSQTNVDLITLYISKWKPSIVIIDGLLDCISNYNDEGQSRSLIDWLKKITNDFNVLVIGVIHLGKKDNHTLGHFGSMADRYAQSVLEVAKDKDRGLFTLKPKYLRSCADFSEINIMYNGQTFEKVHVQK